jgi:hypothetical protein
MNCIISFVARKYHPLFASQGAFQGAADPVAMNMHMTMFPIPRMGVPSRPKKVRIPRRRVPVTGFAEPIQSVKIIHANQNLDTRVAETQPALSQRA